MGANAPSQALKIIEQLLQRGTQGPLPAHWADLTPEQLQLDSLDVVELQLELEAACDLELFGEQVHESPLNTLTLRALGAHIDGLMRARGQTK